MITRLQAYIIYSLRYRYGVAQSNDHLKERANEIISEVIELIFISGSRNWNKEECPNFESFLFGVIKSHIYNSIRSSKGSKFESLNENIESQNNVLDVITGDEFKKEIYNKLKALNADDEELLVFECMSDGITKPDKISLELGIDSQYLNNILRRLYRKFSKIKNNL